MEIESDFCSKHDPSPLAPPRRKSIHKDKKELKNTSVKKSRLVSLVSTAAQPDNEIPLQSDSNSTLKTKANSLELKDNKEHIASDKNVSTAKPKKPPPPSKAAINFYSKFNTADKKTTVDSNPKSKPKPAPRPKLQKPKPAPRNKCHNETSVKSENLLSKHNDAESSNSDSLPSDNHELSHSSKPLLHDSTLNSIKRSTSLNNLVCQNSSIRTKLKRAESCDFGQCISDSFERYSDHYENVTIQKSTDNEENNNFKKRIKQQSRNSSQSYENMANEVNHTQTQHSVGVFLNESIFDPSKETVLVATNHLNNRRAVVKNNNEHLNNDVVFDNVYSTPKSIEVSNSKEVNSQKTGIYYNVILSPTEGFYSTPKPERQSKSYDGVSRSATDNEYRVPPAAVEMLMEKKQGKSANCYEEVDVESNVPQETQQQQQQTKPQTKGWYSSPPPPRPPPPRRTTSQLSSLQNEQDISEDSTERDSHSKPEDSEFSDSESEEEDQEFVKPKDKLFSVANEILSTERSFVYALSLICEEFAASLNTAIAKNSKLLPEGAYGSIFMNIEQIYKLDNKFLQELDERMANWEAENRIGDIVKRFVYFTKMYTTYIKGYDNSMAVYHDCYATNMKFSQIVNQFENSDKSKNLKLTSYLLKPIQRIPSFRLLLIEYQKSLLPDSIEYQDISDSVNTVSEVANDINESMKEGEKFQEVLRIQYQIVNAGDIVKPGRFLLKEGFIHKLSRKELQQRFFVLFTDALLYCSSVGNNHLRLIMELPLARMIVQQPESDDMTNEFIIITTRRSFLLNASSPKERDDWVSCLQNAIDVVNHKIGSFVLNQRQTDSSSELYTDVGGVAPPWIPDSRVTMCQICTVVFTVYKRRHHCRGCGKVVCSSCSAYESPLQYMDYEAARVCETCFTHLSKKFQQLEESGKCDHELLANLRMKFKNAKRKKTKRLLPSTLTEIGTQEGRIETSGFLRLKKGKKEKRCWFVLKDHVLYIYKAPSDPAAISTTPVLGYKVDVSGNWDEEDFLFELTHPGVKDALIFKADNRSTAERWVYCLCKATSLQQMS